jgi:hypothetical protein
VDKTKVVFRVGRYFHLFESHMEACAFSVSLVEQGEKDFHMWKTIGVEFHPIGSIPLPDFLREQEEDYP